MKNVANNDILINSHFYSGPLVNQRQGYVVPPNTPYYEVSTTEWNQVGTTSSYCAVTGSLNAGQAASIKIDGTEYMVNMTDTVRGYVGAGYCVDMWKMTNGRCVLTVEDTGVVFSATSGDAWMQQNIEAPESLFGKTSTVSLLCADGTLRTATGMLSTATVSANKGFSATAASISIGVYKTPAGGAFVQIGNRSGSPVGLVAAKWELGDAQTLANQDASGNWVLNEAPRYADILRACLRYLYIQPDGASDFFSGVLTGSKKTLNIPIMLPAPMRTTPSLLNAPTITNVRTTKGENTTPVVTSASPLKISGKDTMIVITVATETFNDDAHTNNTPAAGYITGIALCAELL